MDAQMQSVLKGVYARTLPYFACSSSTHRISDLQQTTFVRPDRWVNALFIPVSDSTHHFRDVSANYLVYTENRAQKAARMGCGE
jgi:hypothetical protein